MDGDYYFWDPLSAAILVDRSLATFEEHSLTVLEGEKKTQGQIVEDESGVAVDVAVAADARAFEAEFLNTLNADDALTSTRPEPVATLTFDGTSCAYEGPTRLPAELVGVQAENPTSEPWSAVLVAIEDGHTFGDLRILAEGFRQGDQPPEWVEAVSFGQTDPGETSLAAWPLEPGVYGLVCAGEDPGTIHVVTQIVAG